jgi:hypothetical protein
LVSGAHNAARDQCVQPRTRPRFGDHGRRMITYDSRNWFAALALHKADSVRK